MTEKNKFSRFAAGVGAFALAAAGLLGAGVANAATTGDITGDEGSLTIHKFGGNPIGGRDDGRPREDTSGLGTPLAGVEFTVYEVLDDGVPVNLKTFDGWESIKDLTPSTVNTAPWSTVEVGSGTTDSSGMVEWDLPLGLYLVKETGPGTNPIVSPAVPFLVTVPYPGGGGEWLYDVHVYPKNKLNTTVPQKVVEDPGAGLAVGDIVSWTITAPIPPIAADDTYRSFVITDKLDSRVSVADFEITLDGVAGSLVAADFTVTNVSNLATITFTEQGLLKLPGKTNVILTVDTEVESLAPGANETEGVVANQATVNVNGSAVTTGKPAAYFGSIEVTKVNQADPSKTLAGAEFALWTSDGAGNPTGTGPITTGTVGANGKLRFEGLWVGSSPDAIISPAPYPTKQYILQETKAPAGFLTPQGAAALTPVTVTAGGLVAVDVTISNAQRTGPNLPLTGSAGTILFTVVGVGLVLTGGGLLALRRSRLSK